MSAPELRQTVPSSRPYRLWDTTHTTWADRPAGPTVAHDGWNVSYSKIDRLWSSQSIIDGDDGKVTLRLFRMSGDGQSIIHHELHGTKYDTADAAHEAAFGVGAIAVMVYENEVRA